MCNHIEEYTSIRPAYDRFRSKLTELITELIESSDADMASIESRTKSIESFEEKINRYGKNYKNPLEEVTDLCGIRIITYYTEDIYKIAELIENEFKIDKENSVDKTEIQSPDKFGYQSLHYVLSIGPKRNKLAEWKAFKDFNCEIQIRSILQHSWAAIDHKLRYKTKGEIPSKLKRKIYRLSALLELADEEFLSIKNQTKDLHSEIENSIDSGNLDLEFNTLSIHSYFDRNDKIDDIVKVAETIGFIKSVIPQEKEIQNIYYSRLIDVLNNSALNTIEDLDNFLDQIKGSIKAILSRFKNAFDKKQDDFIYAIASDLVLILVVLSEETHVNFNTELIEIIEWGPMTDTFDDILNK